MKNKEYTVKQLQEQIRQATKEVNERITEYYRDLSSDELIDKTIEKIKQTSGKNRQGLIGFNFRGKTKSQLKTQLRRLESFLKIDSITTKAFLEEEKKVKQAYETFKESYGYDDLSISMYKEIADVLGTVGQDVLGTFNYIGVVDEYINQRKTGKKINLVRIIEKNIRNSKGKGFNSKELADNILDELRGV